MIPKGWEGAYFSPRDWGVIILWSIATAILLQECSTWWHQ